MFENVKTYSQLIAAERRDNTKNGNPVYFITMEDGTTGRTERDAMWVCGFGGEAWEGLEVAYDVTRNKNGSYTFTDIQLA